MPTAELQHRPGHPAAGPLLLIASAVLWSFSGVLVKSMTWNAMAIAGARSAIAIPVILLFTGKPRITFSPSQLAGAIAYAGTMAFFILATSMTSAANAIFLQYTAPIYVAVGGHWWLREPTLRSDWVTIPLAIGAIGLFFLDRLSVTGLWGNVFALLSGLCFAGTVLCMRRERASSPATVILLGNILAALISLPFMFKSPPPARELPALLFLGVVQLGLGYGLYSIAIKRVTALEATLIPLLEPVLNPIWVMLAIGETPGQWARLGGAFVLLAVLFRGTLMVWAARQARGLGA
ncbi:MAG TPA: DMT family transporter [Chthoniobacteraceae bacterium]|jgi:drug/metabolite transporter (DMT)-like permease|nr:DMT family transporter [Chthoniobacteraceae bacterium]